MMREAPENMDPLADRVDDLARQVDHLKNDRAHDSEWVVTANRRVDEVKDLTADLGAWLHREHTFVRGLFRTLVVLLVALVIATGTFFTLVSRNQALIEQNAVLIERNEALIQRNHARIERYHLEQRQNLRSIEATAREIRVEQETMKILRFEAKSECRECVLDWRRTRANLRRNP